MDREQENRSNVGGKIGWEGRNSNMGEGRRGSRRKKKVATTEEINYKWEAKKLKQGGKHRDCKGGKETEAKQNGESECGKKICNRRGWMASMEIKTGEKENGDDRQRNR